MSKLQESFNSTVKRDAAIFHLIIKMRLMFVVLVLMFMVLIISSCSDEVEKVIESNGNDTNYIFIKKGVYKDKKGNVYLKVNNSDKWYPKMKKPPKKIRYLKYVTLEHFELEFNFDSDESYGEKIEKVKLSLTKIVGLSKAEQNIKDGIIPLRHLVDLKTIEKISGAYFRDKNYIYIYPGVPCKSGYSFGVVKNKDAVFIDARKEHLKTKSYILSGGRFVHGIDLKTARMIEIENETSKESNVYLGDKTGLFSGGQKMGAFEFCQYFIKYPNQEKIIKKYLNKNISVCKEHYSDEDWNYFRNVK